MPLKAGFRAFRGLLGKHMPESRWPRHAPRSHVHAPDGNAILTRHRWHTVDDMNPASPITYHTTIVPAVLVNKITQDFYHQQWDS